MRISPQKFPLLRLVFPTLTCVRCVSAFCGFACLSQSNFVLPEGILSLSVVGQESLPGPLTLVLQPKVLLGCPTVIFHTLPAYRAPIGWAILIKFPAILVVTVKLGFVQSSLVFIFDRFFVLAQFPESQAEGEYYKNFSVVSQFRRDFQSHNKFSRPEYRITTLHVL